MEERCVLQKITGYDHCIMSDHWFGEWAKEICCLAESQQSPPIMVLLALMENSDSEDPKFQRIVQDLDERGLAFNDTSDAAPADSQELAGYLMFSLKSICEGTQNIEQFNKIITDQFQRIKTQKNLNE